MAYTALPTGFLAQTTAGIRLDLNEPEASPKYSNDVLWPKIVDAWEQIMDDVNGMGESPLVVRYTVPLVDASEVYLLPGNFGRFLRWGADEQGEGVVTELAVPRSRINPYGGKLLFEGNTFRLSPKQKTGSGVTIFLEYVPSGYCPLHLGELDFSSPFVTYTKDASAGTSNTKVLLDNNPSEGYFDATPGKYIGAVMRILTLLETDLGPAAYTYFPVQERMITDVDPETGQATLEPALDFDPTLEGLGAATYEIVPYLAGAFSGAIRWRVANQISVLEDRDGRSARPKRMLAEYVRAIRGIRLRLANINARTGNRFAGDVPGSGRFGWSVGTGSGLGY